MSAPGQDGHALALANLRGHAQGLAQAAAIVDQLGARYRDPGAVAALGLAADTLRTASAELLRQLPPAEQPDTDL